MPAVSETVLFGLDLPPTIRARLMNLTCRGAVHNILVVYLIFLGRMQSHVI